MHQPELPGLDGRPRERSGREDAAAEATLVLREPSSRLAALLEQHRRLLRKVTLRRKSVERLEAELHQFGDRVAVELEPLVESMQAVDEEIHGLFAALLARGRLTREARRQVKEVYELLQLQGMVSPRPAGRSGQGAAQESEAAPDPRAAPASAPRPAVPGADPKAEKAVRGLFLRLAHALHPDRAGQAEDAESRTEAMKEVNHAYRTGDLARLMEIERLWAAGGTAGSGPPDLERRAEELEAMITALRAQLRELDRRQRELKRSDIHHLMRSRGGDAGMAAFVEEGQAELGSLVELRDFVRAFRDGEIPLARFLRGPAAKASELDDELELELELDIEEFDLEIALGVIAPLTDEVAARPPRGKRRRRRR